MPKKFNLAPEDLKIRRLKSRSKFLFVLLGLFGFLTLYQIIKLTIIDSGLYATISDENRIVRVPIYPSRGLIKLGNEEIVVENIVTQALTISSNKTLEEIDAILSELDKLLIFEEDQLPDPLKIISKTKRKYEKLTLLENLTESQIAKFTVEKERWPSVALEARLMRFNLFGPLFSHVTGYVGEITSEEIDNDSFSYQVNSKIGKTGIEKFHEPHLRGGLGFKTIEVDVHGKQVRELETVIPKQASNVYLSLDKELQLLAKKELNGRKGAVVAMDPSTGLIKVMLSSPDYNPNVFNKTIKGNLNTILRDSTSPLFNRAISGNYPPASTIKPFIGLLGIIENEIRWDTTLEDVGFFQYQGEGRRYRGWKEEGHGIVDLKKSIIESSDVFFYELATKLTIERISDFLLKFGFGLKSGIDLSYESEGILPDRKWKLGFIGESWFIGDTINMGIGQGYITATPLQLALAVSVIANNGVAYKPRVVERIDSMKTNKEAIYQIDFVDSYDWIKIQDSMAKVVSAWNGTAYNLSSFAETKIAGKTGTAQIKSLTDEELTVKEEYEGIRVEEGNRDHALFVGYGPLTNPRLTVVVIVENGESGSAVAAPIAQKIIDKYLEEKK